MDKNTTMIRPATMSLRNIRLTNLFKPEDIIHNVEADSAEEVSRQLLEKLAIRYGIGSVDEAMAAVMDRIAKSDVIIGPGLAVPHARLEGLGSLRIAIATSEKGVKVDCHLCQVVILILVPVDMPGAYMQALQGIAKVCDKPNAAGSIAKLKTSLEVWQYFDAGGHKLPDHLESRHIMTEPRIWLEENDSLARAIDLFLEHGATELPVLDSEKELIGVVTTSQLVRVCLPDYLMWMDDMTPFLNFEPFAEIIRRETSTWLNDIMISDYAEVTEDAPAILAMKEIGRKQTDYAYVVKNRKLVGIISLHEFLRRVLR